MDKIFQTIIPSSIIRHKLDSKGCILLTFDDGPDPEVTPRVLDVLDKYDARGLFFVTGKRTRYAPEIIKYILVRKHIVGNHTYSHLDCSKLSFSEIVNEIQMCKNLLYSVAGIYTKYFRPPRGIVSLSLIWAARRTQHKIIRWSLDSGEYSYLKNAILSSLVDNYLDMVQDRAIILSHDDNFQIPKLLDKILPELKSRGFDLKSGLYSLDT